MDNNVYLHVWIAGFRGVQVKARLFRMREARRQGFLNCAVKVVFVKEQRL